MGATPSKTWGTATIGGAPAPFSARPPDATYKAVLAAKIAIAPFAALSPSPPAPAKLSFGAFMALFTPAEHAVIATQRCTGRGDVSAAGAQRGTAGAGGVAGGRGVAGDAGRRGVHRRGAGGADRRRTDPSRVRVWRREGLTPVSLDTAARGGP